MCENGGDDPVRRPADQVPDHWTTDAKAGHHKLLDFQVVHQRKLVVGESVPGFLDLQRARRAAAIGVAGVERDAAMGIGELDDGLKLLPVLIGLFAVSQIITDVVNIKQEGERVPTSHRGLFIKFSEWKKHIVNLFRSSAIGTWVGILPGIGANIGHQSSASVSAKVRAHMLHCSKPFSV